MTVDVSATHLLKRGLVESASKSAALTCIALTKADVVPRDCDNSHRQMLIDSARLSFVTNLDVIMVNSTSADELVEYLGNVDVFVRNSCLICGTSSPRCSSCSKALHL